MAQQQAKVIVPMLLFHQGAPLPAPVSERE